MPLNTNITLMGELNDYQLSGDAMHAMNNLYELINGKGGGDFLGKLAADARLGTETGLRHWTCKKPKQSIFFRAGNSTGPWRLQIYGHGTHHGDNNKQYDLYTWEHGKKTKTYSF